MCQLSANRIAIQFHSIQFRVHIRIRQQILIDYTIEYALLPVELTN